MKSKYKRLVNAYAQKKHSMLSAYNTCCLLRGRYQVKGPRCGDIRIWFVVVTPSSISSYFQWFASYVMTRSIPT